LVIVKNSEPIPVLWSVLSSDSLADAREALRIREGIPSSGRDRSIGYWSQEGASEHDEVECIAEWALRKGLTGVVWTALKPRFEGRAYIPTAAQVVAYLEGLRGDTRLVAEEYIRRAPSQVNTAYRRKIREVLGWHD